MDRFDKEDLLEEFLVRWTGGKSVTQIEKELINQYNPNDVAICRKIFETWKSKKNKSWSAIKRIRY